MIIISSLKRSSLTYKHGKKFLFSSHKNEIDVLLLLHLISDRNPHIFNCRKICRGCKNLVSSCPGVAFATPCHPMATGLQCISSQKVQFILINCKTCFDISHLLYCMQMEVCVVHRIRKFCLDVSQGTSKVPVFLSPCFNLTYSMHHWNYNKL